MRFTAELGLISRYLYPCASRRMKKAKTDFKEYMDAFEDELQSFLQRVKERAQARIDKAIKEAEEVTLNKPFSNSIACTLASYILSFMTHVVFRFLLVLYIVTGVFALLVKTKLRSSMFQRRLDLVKGSSFLLVMLFVGRTRTETGPWRFGSCGSI